MASTRLKETKDGKKYYEIRVRMGRDKAELSSRWYVPEGWSQKAIDRELAKVSAEYERQCKAGEVKTKKQVRAEQEQKALEDAKIPTLKTFAETVFLPYLAENKSEHCRSAYKGVLEKHIYPALGSMKLRDITEDEITELLALKQREGLKAASCKKYHTILCSLFKMAKAQKKISRNPMLEVERPRPTKAEGKDSTIKAFTKAEAIRILECANKEPLQWKTLTYLLLLTGCRKGEALGLKWNCVNFKTGTLLLCNNLCYTPAKGVYEDTLKNGKSREIPCPQIVMDLLAELRESRRSNVITLDKTGGYVFTQEGTSEHMHPDSPTWYFRKFGDRYGIKDLHPHKLRHTFASIAIKNGEDVASVAAVLGHSSPNVTMNFYVSAYEEGKRHASDTVSNALAVNE